VYAAALAAGPSAVISHTSAAPIRALYGVAPDGIEITVPSGEARRLDGVRIHRSTTLQPDDVDIRYGVAVTSAVRTLIDLAPRFHKPLLGKIVDEGAISHLWTAEILMARIGRFPQRAPGLAELRSVLVARMGEGHPDSVLEQRIIRIVKRHFSGFELHPQVTVGGEVFIMDIAWLDLKVDAEIDGLAVRTTSLSKLDHVLRRDNKLRRHGWRVVHLTASMTEAEIVAELVPYIPRRGSAA
jgi:very-short-patch-repair endonuclease